MRLCSDCVPAALWLCYDCCSSCCISEETGSVMAALPARREWKCLQFLWLLQSSSSLLAHALTTLGSANSVHSVNSKIVGTMSRISNTLPKADLIVLHFGSAIHSPKQTWLSSTLCFFLLTLDSVESGTMVYNLCYYIQNFGNRKICHGYINTQSKLSELLQK